MSLFIVILALPMLSGRWLASADGDQYYSGYAVKVWAKDTYRQTGQFPLWNPMIMVGLPHIDVVTHGDVLYPTSALRLVMPVYQAMNIAFVIHYILAGFLMYLFLRRLGASWIGSVTGGLAYQLSGIMISYVHPGHDGKLFVSTMLPLAFLALLAALRDKRAWGYPLLALAVALCLLSPHVQTTYYLLIAAALFALYLTFGEPSSDPVGQRVGRLALTLAAVIVGFGLAMPQILPFIQYIPHSPRAGGYAVGYQGSTSYGIPWNHIPEFIIAGFTGKSFETYWGSNPLKLHSEYLGLPVVALAMLGWGDRRRRLVLWIAGIGTLFLLIALGASTPFYHLWWAVMPYVKKTRAPGMVFFIVAFCTAIFAAFGVDRVERRDVVAARHARVWLIAAGVVALLGLVGVFGQLAQSLAPAERLGLAIARGSFIRVSVIIGAILFASVALLAWGWIQGRVPVLLFATGLPLLVGADLWRNGQDFWTYSPSPDEGVYRTDPLIARLQAEPKPLRVLNLGDVYPHNVLMAFGIPQVVGYQGSELRYFDDLIGGRPGTPDAARYLLTSTRLWHLLAARYVIIPDTANLPGYHRVLGPVTTATGTRGFLYEADTLPPYVRVIPAAAKIDEQAIPATLADPRLPGYDRVVLLPLNAPINPRPVTTFPPPSASRGRVTTWTAGRMSIALDPPPTDSSYVLIAENWYLDWSVVIDGRPGGGQVLRGDNSLLTVPVGPGARRLELSYHSRAIARGIAIALVSLLIVIAGFLVPPAWQRRPGSG
ncbi:MAG: hypothetical protein AUH41_02725 [Gemmatimonadetes bacterium 13_1_40CM_66_11]|nr:MAG: hypothetical protein AUH41_02725 [Gemmatimonadetes bacterium 13_1_40CM_66_11]